MDKYYNGMFGGVFKYTLCTEDNNILLRWLLECCLEIKIDTLILKDKELSKNNTHTKGKVVDLYVQTNTELINVEINNHPHSYNNERNLAYLANLYSRSVDISEDYNKVRKCIQLNLTSGKKGIDLKSEYVLLKRNDLKEEVFSENFKIYEINVDLLKEAYYNNDVEIVNKYKPVIMLTLNREELEEFSLGDERIMEYKKRVEDLNSDPEFMVFMSREEDQRKTENTLRNIVNEQSQELKEQSQRIEKQTQKLETQTKQIENQTQELSNIKWNTARKLKEKNVDIEIISETTGLSIEEIQNL